ncbi:MAG: quinohemoprotein amine dehydrogenase subunit alpha [Proteobacteria bacterium]|nr:quinohemoprotein amine dehydrogenase subunit alpha [Pseudomonadota bacterium]
MKHLLLRCLVLLGPAFALPALAAPPDPSAVRAHCSGCHRESSPGHFDRISDMRKTPEGWEMTLFRMHQVHGVVLDDDARTQVLRYLTSVGGLAPAEAAPARFALERRPNVQDLSLGDEMGVMCGRCHSLARAALQRRDAPEWLKLAHTHVGQWPTLEYQQSGRDRFWWESATKELPAKLAALYPLDTPAWRKWSAGTHASPVGRWLVWGHAPGRGDYHGTAVIAARGTDGYSATYTLTYADGTALNGTSKSVVYTGYEWRGSATLGQDDVREVYALSEDGARLSGRWFVNGHAEVGGDWHAARAEGAPAVFAVLPRALRAGAATEVVVVGRGLGTSPAFGAGVTASAVKALPDGLHATLAVAADAAPGVRPVTAGGARNADAAVVYAKIDRVVIEPQYGIARVGGGKVAPVIGQFEAVGYIDAAGKPGGIALGPLPASWSVAPHDEQAKAAEDVKFTGTMDASGKFLPAVAGPDPQRPFSGNNVGDLAVIGTVKDGDRSVSGKAHLVVTVQRWNTPPIY